MYSFFFVKQKTAYEMRISDWSSDVCSSDLYEGQVAVQLHRILDRAASGTQLSEGEIVALFATRGAAAQAVVEAADALRAEVSGDTVTYVVNRHINYTNICTHACSFCAFSKTSTKGGFPETHYNPTLQDTAARPRGAGARGGTAGDL